MPWTIAAGSKVTAAASSTTPMPRRVEMRRRVGGRARQRGAGALERPRVRVLACGAGLALHRRRGTGQRGAEPVAAARRLRGGEADLPAGDLPAIDGHGRPWQRVRRPVHHGGVAAAVGERGDGGAGVGEDADDAPRAASGDERGCEAEGRIAARAPAARRRDAPGNSATRPPAIRPSGTGQPPPVATARSTDAAATSSPTRAATTLVPSGSCSPSTERTAGGGSPKSSSTVVPSARARPRAPFDRGRVATGLDCGHELPADAGALGELGLRQPERLPTIAEAGGALVVHARILARHLNGSHLLALRGASSLRSCPCG